MKKIIRKKYIDLAVSLIGTPDIKIITGVRRSGKSCLLDDLVDYVVANLSDYNIVKIDFNDFDWEYLRNSDALHKYVTNHYIEGKRNIIFIDEVQMCDGFERVLNSLHSKGSFDIFVTGSNAFLLSSDLATLFTGRYIEIQVLPFSLSEYQKGMNLSLNQLYNQYITTTSLPYTLQLTNSEAVSDYLQNIYQTIVIKDILSRGKIQDPDLLNRILRYLSDNIGNISSIKSITDTLASNGRKVSTHTVDNYIDLLCASFMFYKVFRYDVKGKEHLRTGTKYYICDIGLRNWLLGLRGGDLGHILENIVFLHLLRQGKQVMVGKVGTKEIDFVCFQNGKTEYYQVALSVRDENVLARELAPLNTIKDNYPKYLITLDPDPEINHNGIIQQYALDWLLNI